MNENYAPKGYEPTEIISRTSSRKTNDGKELFLATTRNSRIDQEGIFGPYVLIVINGVEEVEYRIIGKDDDFVLRTEFRKSLSQGRELSVDQVIERLERKYLSLS